MQPADRSLLVDDRDGVRWLTFNRPEVHNAQDVEMLELLDAALADTAASADIRAVVIAGTGRSFCSGHDLRQIATDDGYRVNASTAEGRFWQEERLFSGPVQRLRELRVPTICRVQGYCLAAGLMFASVADFVVATPDARFGSPILRSLGVNDAELASFMLRVAEPWAKRVLWLGEQLTASQALDAGLVTWVVDADDLDAFVTDVTSRLAEVPPVALAMSKMGFQFMADRRGEQDVNRYHVMSHQLSHQTAESKGILDARVQRVKEGASPIPESQRR